MKHIRNMMKWLFPSRFLERRRRYRIALVGEKQKPLYSEFSCPYSPTRKKFSIMVLDRIVHMKESPFCIPCTQEYLNRYSTLCNSCREPIFVGEPVGDAGRDAEHPYTHLTVGCCPTGGLYCGVWGEGRLITLHALNPERFPENASCVAAHALSTRSTVIENL